MVFLSASVHMSGCACVHLPVHTLADLTFYHPAVTNASFKEAVQAQNVSRIFSFEQTWYFSQPLDQMKITYTGDNLEQWNEWNVMLLKYDQKEKVLAAHLKKTQWDSSLFLYVKVI